ncbi:hypothetical protein HL57_gp38 [Leuconostoc phage phiLNTR2]|jgi:hypothetical protein|uniref:Uncharacterized protein n=1 Tax=Leuconostoc phage LN34 TaxID=1262519 RepID=A0A059PAM6_9CAUD|nr:hypothetical protein HL52_gp37 [Leuconostoc phage LN34]YP_009044950.1 hypothetical protein HL57_gp38 [Leuconostoc phage phiLNTR2]AFY98447.1 hypothetical protein phiLN34_037 [Leuconostoc phage LN34]AFY98489.1 hypothetical protein phiLNTR2_038 [Leuconostoc phage phiLNTR2]
MNILVSTILVIVLGFSMLLVWGLVSALATNINVKTLEKRRSVMLDIIEEEIITQAETQPDKVNAPDIVIQLNRRMNIKKFTQTDILHMTITTLKSLKLKGVL